MTIAERLTDMWQVLKEEGIRLTGEERLAIAWRELAFAAPEGWPEEYTRIAEEIRLEEGIDEAAFAAIEAELEHDRIIAEVLIAHLRRADVSAIAARRRLAPGALDPYVHEVLGRLDSLRADGILGQTNFSKDMTLKHVLCLMEERGLKDRVIAAWDEVSRLDNECPIPVVAREAGDFHFGRTFDRLLTPIRAQSGLDEEGFRMLVDEAIAERRVTAPR